MTTEYTYEDYINDYQGFIAELSDCCHYPYYSKGSDYKQVLESLRRFEARHLDYTRIYLGEDYINDSLHLEVTL